MSNVYLVIVLDIVSLRHCHCVYPVIVLAIVSLRHCHCHCVYLVIVLDKGFDATEGEDEVSSSNLACLLALVSRPGNNRNCHF